MKEVQERPHMLLETEVVKRINEDGYTEDETLLIIEYLKIEDKSSILYNFSYDSINKVFIRIIDLPATGKIPKMQDVEYGIRKLEEARKTILHGVDVFTVDEFSDFITTMFKKLYAIHPFVLAYDGVSYDGENLTFI